MVPYNVQNDFSLQCRPSVSKILIIIFEYTRLLSKDDMFRWVLGYGFRNISSRTKQAEK